MSEGTIILNKDSQTTQTTAVALGINTDINTANVQTENTLNIDHTLAHQQAVQRAASDISSADPTKAKHQYGLREDQIKSLKENIIQGSGKNGN